METTAPYRDDRASQASEAAAFRQQWLRRAEQAKPIRALIRRQQARLIGGAVGVAGAAALFGLVVASFIPSLRSDKLTFGLFDSALAAAIAYLLVRVLGRSRSVMAPARADDPFADMAQLVASRDPLDSALERARSLQVASLALPMIAVVLLVPLMLHFLVATVLFKSSDFNVWIALTTPIVAQAYLALSVLCVRAVRRWRTEDADTSTAGGWSALGMTTMVSALPWALLYLLPPAIVFVTGALFVPLLFSRAYRIASEERALLEAAEAGLVPCKGIG